MRPATSPHAAVLVFGDLGRSPRMFHHAIALAENGFRVALVGYPETALPSSVADHPAIRILPIRTFRRCPESYPRLAFLAWTLVRMGWAQLLALWALLVSMPKPDVLLVQNPPTAPTLVIGRLVSRLRGARFVVDWHNFGYSMLALRLGRESALVRLLRRHEGAAGRRADGHLCVSRAMAERLASDLGVRGAAVLYDRPLRLAEPLARDQRREMLASLLPDARIDDRTLVLHCPTSWTDDEATDLLLEAAPLLEARGGKRVLIVVTGTGPRRGAFEQALAASAPARRLLHTAFFSSEDYRRMLAAADCGLSLHRSSSGVDLPMKLVDFFGAGTPALALDYGACLQEQVEDGREALLFHDAAGLCRCIQEISNDDRLEALRRNVGLSWRETWEEAWRRAALPLLERRQ